MLKFTKEKLAKALETEPAGDRRAKMWMLYHMSASPNIAQNIINESRTDYHVTLLCEILVNCGAATLNKSANGQGFFKFEDRSQIWEENWVK